jgi:hypothetical protein
MLSDVEILQAVERLRDEWTDLVGDDADMLSRHLDGTTYDDLESVRQTANRVLDLLERHPQARMRVNGELGIKGDVISLRAAYVPTLGESGEIPAGTLMVCPVDPAHYRRRLRQKGQKLFCPQHGKPLVLADSLPLRSGQELPPKE